jgi:hypothetical protein
MSNRGVTSYVAGSIHDVTESALNPLTGKGPHRNKNKQVYNILPQTGLHKKLYPDDDF